MTSLSKIIDSTIKSTKFIGHSKNTIIRDLTGTLGRLSPPIDGVKLENCKDQTLQSKNESLKQRIDSYLNASRILIDNYFADDPIKKSKYKELLEKHITKIQNQITTKYNEGKLKKDDFIFASTQLTTFIEKSTSMDLKTSFKALLDAENINSWEQNKANLITVSKHGEDTIIQMDEPISSLTKSQALEYMAIYKNPPEKPPKWFSKLPKWHQNYLKNKLKSIHTRFEQSRIENTDLAVSELIKSLNDTLSSPPSTIRYYPGLSNYSQHTIIILDNEGNEKLRSSKERGSTATVEAIRASATEDIDTKRQYDEDRKRLSKQNLSQLLAPEIIKAKVKQFETDWGISIDSLDQFALPVVYTSNLSPLAVDDYMNAMSVTNSYIERTGSTHYDNNSIMVEEKARFFNEVLSETRGKLETLSSSSMDFPNISISGVSTNYSINNERGLATPSEDLKSQQDNLIKTTTKTLTLIATKINGTSPREDLDPDGELNDLEILNEACASSNDKDPTRGMSSTRKARYHTILEAVNQYKRIIDNGLSESKPNQEKPIIPDNPKSKSAFGLFWSSISQKATRSVIFSRLNSGLKRAKIFGRSIGGPFIKMFDQTNYNLFLSSYEQILAQQMGGIGFGHCKSGKDRKGLEIIHTDAMLIYYNKYGSFPKDHNDLQFVDILVEHIKTNHQQLMATYNAPGCCGLQNLIDILPASVALKLQKEMDHNHFNAKLNKPTIVQIEECLEDKKYIGLTSDKEFAATDKSIQQIKTQQIIQHQNRGLSQLQHDSSSPIIRNEDIKLTTEKKLVNIKSLNSAFNKITTNKITEYSIKETKVEDKGSYSECIYKLQNDTEHMLTVDVSGIEMEEFNTTSVKISIEMLIKTYGVNAELSYDGMDQQQISECEEIRKTIVESYSDISNSPSVTLDEEVVSTPSHRNSR